MNVRMVLVPPEKSKERWNCIFYKTKKAILVGIFSSKLPDSSKESPFVRVKNEVLQNRWLQQMGAADQSRFGKPITLESNNLGQQGITLRPKAFGSIRENRKT